MQVFKNILVGIDLAQCKPLAVSGLNAIALEPIDWGMRLAKANHARLVFLSAANIGDEALAPLAEEDRLHVRATVTAAGTKLLEELVQRAKRQGIDAQHRLVTGKGWHELVRQVLRDKHDLVVVGTRDLTGLRRMLFGNTAMKLLRRCPCPVLVTKVGTDIAPLNILIATDLKPASEALLKLGIALGRQANAHVHVLHVAEYKLDDVCHTGLPDAKQSAYRLRVRARAEQALQSQLEQTGYRAHGERVHIHLLGGVGRPDVAIQHFIQTHDIDLLVMGTIGRGGIPGIMIGNTAERLLPEVHCSVLAVKPPDFVCPLEG